MVQKKPAQKGGRMAPKTRELRVNAETVSEIDEVSARLGNCTRQEVIRLALGLLKIEALRRTGLDLKRLAALPPEERKRKISAALASTP